MKVLKFNVILTMVSRWNCRNGPIKRESNGKHLTLNIFYVKLVSFCNFVSILQRQIIHHSQYQRGYTWDTFGIIANHISTNNLPSSRFYKTVSDFTRNIQKVSSDIIARQSLGTKWVKTRIEVSWKKCSFTVAYMINSWLFSNFQVMEVVRICEKTSPHDQ